VIPYFSLETIHLGPIPIHVFGLLLALGFLLGQRIAVRELTRTRGPAAARVVERGAGWALVGGLIGAHLLHVLGYHPELLHQQGAWALLRLWDGFSSVGGLIGGAVALGIVLRRHGLRWGPHLNAMALGVAPGWALARVGCFLVHDHPGVRTHFPLAVAFPDGPRHDLGLDDLLVLAALSALLFALRRLGPREGALAGVLAIGYAVPRFFLDFLRATDLPNSDGRLLGLTPAQYVALLLVPLGAWLLLRTRRPPTLAEPAPA
jgi:phosphatidylglycerol:prolipoprotein diacylglycerol transferase